VPKKNLSQFYGLLVLREMGEREREKKRREKEKRDKEFLLLGCKRKRKERPNFSGGAPTF
jgi:hypothetical protein